MCVLAMIRRGFDPGGCRREDKLLHVMTLLKLGLVKRKVLLFVNSVDAGFRLRLFLESFGLRSAVINAELPMNSRHHILQVCVWSHLHPSGRNSCLPLVAATPK